jgi:hypothetical protein
MKDYLLVCWYTLCWWTVVVLMGYLAYVSVKELLGLLRR